MHSHLVGIDTKFLAFKLLITKFVYVSSDCTDGQTGIMHWLFAIVIGTKISCAGFCILMSKRMLNQILFSQVEMPYYSWLGISILPWIHTQQTMMTGSFLYSHQSLLVLHLPSGSLFEDMGANGLKWQY